MVAAFSVLLLPSDDVMPVVRSNSDVPPRLTKYADRRYLSGNHERQSLSILGDRGDMVSPMFANR